jgi:hypothetical protein
VFAASGAIPSIEKQIQQQENLISILLGENPGECNSRTGTDRPAALPEVPPGLPSSLLERRPDIREAEAQLMAMNAQIGVAKPLISRPSVSPVRRCSEYRALQLFTGRRACGPSPANSLNRSTPGAA